MPAIWADLNRAGLVSGHACSKGLRTVKTCVGTEHCRFGTQDSTGLGVKLEQILWGSWPPHKVKLGVSGCPRNCAEATRKDVGIVCVDSGYQVGVAGTAGMDVKETERLADAIVLTGSNLAWCHPVLYQRIAAAKAARPAMKVVVIDPRRTPSCDMADHGHLNQAYLDAHVNGFAKALGAARSDDPAAIGLLPGYARFGRGRNGWSRFIRRASTNRPAAATRSTRS